MNHKEVISVGVKFLKKFGCSVILDEFVCTAGLENPDAFGFKSGYSIIIEAKASRSDFLADKKKFTRRSPKHGVGNYRMYACPKGLIKESELPDGWGLIYCEHGKFKVVVGPDDNWINPMGEQFKWFETDLKYERSMLISALRRVDKKEIKNCNYKVYVQEI